jgi:hypothetical protein
VFVEVEVLVDVDVDVVEVESVEVLVDVEVDVLVLLVLVVSVFVVVLVVPVDEVLVEVELVEVLELEVFELVDVLDVVVVEPLDVLGEPVELVVALVPVEAPDEVAALVDVELEVLLPEQAVPNIPTPTKSKMARLMNMVVSSPELLFEAAPFDIGFGATIALGEIC